MHLVRTKNEKEKKTVCMFVTRYMKHTEAIKRKDIVNNFVVTYLSHFTILFFSINTISLHGNSHIAFIQQYSRNEH